MRIVLLVGFLLFVFSLLLTTNYQLPTIYAASSLDFINQRICDRFEEDLNKMAAIMEEVRSRKGIKETRVAYGGIDTPIKYGDYWITFAAEALAYQRVQHYNNVGSLRQSLGILAGKILKAKGEIRRVLNE